MKAKIQELILPEVRGSPKKQAGRSDKTQLREGELHTIEEGVSR